VDVLDPLAVLPLAGGAIVMRVRELGQAPLAAPVSPASAQQAQPRTTAHRAAPDAMSSLRNVSAAHVNPFAASPAQQAQKQQQPPPRKQQQQQQRAEPAQRAQVQTQAQRRSDREEDEEDEGEDAFGEEAAAEGGEGGGGRDKWMERKQRAAHKSAMLKVPPTHTNSAPCCRRSSATRPAS
jgi:hypothetical protein